MGVVGGGTAAAHRGPPALRRTAMRAALMCRKPAVVPRHYTGNEGGGPKCQNCPAAATFRSARAAGAVLG
ncbi:hypothetical protein NDU88_002929 [Pleurodeles waltl]|uniref:Uncharacterized protein n=1 Tax=Pleurodeles waltl TaxID=8319 RepID=A0AAV7KW55_PLEWA|nr:hypothetical protein NDU88_002929 [Pleurodeles waltl]